MCHLVSKPVANKAKINLLWWVKNLIIGGILNKFPEKDSGHLSHFYLVKKVIKKRKTIY